MTGKVGLVNCLEIQCHLDGVAHHDVVSGRRHENISSGETVVRPIIPLVQLDFGVGPLDALCKFDIRIGRSCDNRINLSRAQCRRDCCRFPNKQVP